MREITAEPVDAGAFEAYGQVLHGPGSLKTAPITLPT